MHSYEKYDAMTFKYVFNNLNEHRETLWWGKRVSLCGWHLIRVFPDYVLFFDHQIKIFLKQTRLLSKDYTNLKFVVEDVVKNDFRIFDFSDISFHLTNIL